MAHTQSWTRVRIEIYVSLLLRTENGSTHLNSVHVFKWVSHGLHSCWTSNREPRVKSANKYIFYGGLIPFILLSVICCLVAVVGALILMRVPLSKMDLWHVKKMENRSYITHGQRQLASMGIRPWMVCPGLKQDKKSNRRRTISHPLREDISYYFVQEGALAYLTDHNKWPRRRRWLPIIQSPDYVGEYAHLPSTII